MENKQNENKEIEVIKKPFWKKWWFWTIIVFIILFVIILLGEDKPKIIPPTYEDSIQPTWHPPHKPEHPHILIDKSDLIVFGEVVEVFDEKRMIGNGERKKMIEEGIVGHHLWFDRQNGSIKILRILKGSDEYSSKIINITKERSDFFLEVGRRRLFYLKMVDGQYHTVDIMGAGNYPWGLSKIKNLKMERGEIDKGGMVIEVVSGAVLLPEVKIHLLRGRLKAPIEKGDQRWEEHFIKTLRIDEFGIYEVELTDGNYTFLLEFEGNLYSHSRFYHPSALIDEPGGGYYPLVIVESNWRIIHFHLDRIREMRKDL